MIYRTGMVLALLAVAGCTQSVTNRAPTDPLALAPQSIETHRLRFEPDALSGCWGGDESPAVIQTVRTRAQSMREIVDRYGKRIEAPVYTQTERTRLRQDRQFRKFEVVCPDRQTPQLVATLQRALKVRGYYLAPVTGRMDRDTKTAIRSYQKATQGLSSTEISLVMAEELGVVVDEELGQAQ